jgi:hypothetical protein
LTHQESLAVGQVEPIGFEMTRAGRRQYLAYNGTAPTGIAPVQAFPTTAAQWVIWNADPIKHYVIKSLGAILISGTNAVGGTLLATIFQAPAQIGANAAGLTTMNGSSSTFASKAIIKSAVTITGPAAPNWAPVADAILSGVATLPSTIIVNRGVDGRIIVPAGMGLGLCVLAPAGTTQLFLPIAEWVELESDIE